MSGRWSRSWADCWAGSSSCTACTRRPQDGRRLPGDDFELSMTLVHVLAAVISAWWLRHDERAAWTLARRIADMADRSIRALLAFIAGLEPSPLPSRTVLVPAVGETSTVGPVHAGPAHGARLAGCVHAGPAHGARLAGCVHAGPAHGARLAARTVTVPGASATSLRDLPGESSPPASLPPRR
jgi:hypothetical protein